MALETQHSSSLEPSAEADPGKLHRFACTSQAGKAPCVQRHHCAVAGGKLSMDNGFFNLGKAEQVGT